MFWTLLALLLMITLGGFISYYGDLQGRRWGKRRVSWFGLRPKHTAIIITSLTGAFIALMSIATVLIASPTVREVVLRGERALEDNKKALKENRQLNTRLAVEKKKATGELEQLTASKKQLSNQVSIQKLELTLARKEVAEAKEKLAPVQAEVARLETAQKKLETTLRQEQAAIRQKSRELEAKRKELLTKIAENKRASESNADLIQQLQKLEAQQSRLSASSHELEEGNKELQQAKDNMTRVIASLSQQQQEFTHKNGALMEANKQLLSQNNELETTNHVRKTDLDRVNRQLSRSKAELDQAVSHLADAGQTFTQSYHALRQGDISIRAGAELARRIVPDKLSSEGARKQLVQLLEEAGETAGVYGADKGENGRAVRIVSKKVVRPFDSQDAGENASLDALADVIASNSEQVLVVATSLNNCLRGEQAIIELHPFTIKRVFDKEEAVASRTIDASLSPERIQQAIADFLQRDVKNSAVRAGSIPRVNPITGAKEIGVFDSLALGQLAGRIKRLGGHVLLTAVATTRLTSADPLNDASLRLDIKHSP